MRCRWDNRCAKQKRLATDRAFLVCMRIRVIRGRFLLLRNDEASANVSRSNHCRFLLRKLG
jgi:hypothetical protein